MWSARSAARTNDMDTDKRRKTIACGGSPTVPNHTKISARRPADA